VTKLRGKRAFITGASRGVGAAVAHALAGAGAQVGLASRTVDDLGIDGAVARACDVTDPASVQAAVDATVGAFGGLDIVVANAGVGSYGDFLDIPVKDAEAMIDVNLKGTLHTARATLPHLIAAGGGDFLSLASVAGLRAFPGETVYNASKYGMVGFTRALDHEMREHDVRCTCVCPGGVKTEFAMGTGRTPDMPELEGMMSPEDVAEVVLFTVTRPRSMRILTTSFRPMSEGSWG
jgi:NADP-dependent 3-hydroxy acid dehydrogenase YdfG